uniref:BSD domain-containing protein n=1 Tax=Aegilops tauschii subsp. strangulata TaxID=200361 RepID=A0A453PGH1_AEGTS
MDLWERARSFAGEAAKRSQELSLEAAKRSSVLVSETAKKSKEIFSETAIKSREMAAEATKQADLLAGQIMHLASDIPVPSIPPIPAISPLPSAAESEPDAAELERYGITDDLREFVNGMTISTFRDFPLQDEPEMSDVPTVSNVRQDLNEWQARHATLVLSAVKEISKFRYELCPRYMKERKFWRVYFLLVNNYVTPYETKYFEELKVKAEEEKMVAQKEISQTSQTTTSEQKDMKVPSKTSTSSNREQDLDVFLLGDLGSDDEGPDAGDDDELDDDFDKIDGASGI